MIKYKKCECDENTWEEIIVKDDENYQNRCVIYFYCMDCDIDFRVEDLYTGEEVFYSPFLSLN